METLKAIIIDDEKNALDVLKIQLTEYCTDIEILDLCNGGAEGIKAIKAHKPDLVFLDIEMPHKNGFDVLNETKDLTYKVIFTTAYDQFAVKAFKYSAVDYLLKPIDIAELQEAVQKVKTEDKASFSKKIESLFNQFKQSSTNSKIALPVGDAMQLVDANTILRCESESNYTHIFLENGKKITTAKTLKDVEEILSDSIFCRVHQSHLININRVSKVARGENMYVTLEDDSNIPVSRNKKDSFLDRLKRL